MRIINVKELDDFKRKHADVSSQIDSWCAEVSVAKWENTHHIRQRYATASLLSNNRVVFNLKGNKYRLLVQVSYKSEIVFVKKIGTHNDYVKWQLS